MNMEEPRRRQDTVKQRLLIDEKKGKTKPMRGQNRTGTRMTKLD